MATKKKIVRRHAPKKPSFLTSFFSNRLTLSLTITVVVIVASLVTAALAYGRGPLVPLFATTTGIYQIEVQIETPEELSQIQKPEILFAAPPKGPISDDPTAAAVAAATRQKAIQDKLGITNEASIKKAAEQGAQQSIQLATQATGATPKPAAVTAQQVQQAANTAMTEVKKAEAKKKAAGSNAAAGASPVIPSTLVDANGPKCAANNGTMMNQNEGVLGSVDSATRKNKVFTCTAQGTWLYCGLEGDPKCPVTIKPVYQGGKNCFKGNTVYKPGDTLKDGDKYQKCEEGNWVTIPVPDVAEAAPAPAAVQPQAPANNAPAAPKTPKEVCEDPKNGGTWDEVNQRCGAGPGNCTGRFGWDPDKKICQEKSTLQTNCEAGGGTWSYATSQCGAGAGNQPKVVPLSECTKDLPLTQDCAKTSIGGKESWYRIDKKALVQAPGAFGESAVGVVGDKKKDGEGCLFGGAASCASNQCNWYNPLDENGNRKIIGLYCGGGQSSGSTASQGQSSATQTGQLGRDRTTTNPNNCQYNAIPQQGGVYICSDAAGTITTPQQAVANQAIAAAPQQVKKKDGESCSITGTALWGAIPGGASNCASNQCNWYNPLDENGHRKFIGWYCGGGQSGGSTQTQQSANGNNPQNPQGVSSAPITTGNNKFSCQGSIAMVADKTTNNIVDSTQCGSAGCNPNTGKCNPEQATVNTTTTPVKKIKDGESCSITGTALWGAIPGDFTNCESNQCSWYNPLDENGHRKFIGWYCGKAN